MTYEKNCAFKNIINEQYDDNPININVPDWKLDKILENETQLWCTEYQQPRQQNPNDWEIAYVIGYRYDEPEKYYISISETKKFVENIKENYHRSMHSYFQHKFGWFDNTELELTERLQRKNTTIMSVNTDNEWGDSLVEGTLDTQYIYNPILNSFIDKGLSRDLILDRLYQHLYGDCKYNQYERHAKKDEIESIVFHNGKKIYRYRIDVSNGRTVTIKSFNDIEYEQQQRIFLTAKDKLEEEWYEESCINNRNHMTCTNTRCYLTVHAENSDIRKWLINNCTLFKMYDDEEEYDRC